MRRSVSLVSIALVLVLGARRVHAHDIKAIYYAASSGVQIYYAIDGGCLLWEFKNTNSYKVSLAYEYDTIGSKGSVNHRSESDLLLDPGQVKRGGAFMSDDTGLADCPWYGSDQHPTTFKNFRIIVRNLDAAEQARQQQQQAREQREREQQERQQQEQQQQQEQRQRQEEQERQREEQERRQEEERRQQEDAQRQREEQERQQRQNQQQLNRTAGRDGAGGGGGATTASRSSSATSTPGTSGPPVAAATTAALAGGVALVAFGAMSDVKDRITPFEINVGAKIGFTGRGEAGILLGVGAELHWMHWDLARPRKGEVLSDLEGRLHGHEIYVTGTLGGLFVSWEDPVLAYQCPLCNSSKWQTGLALYGELGYRHWWGWLGGGGFIAGLHDSTTQVAVMNAGKPPEQHDGATLGGEMLFALHRSSRKVSVYGGLRVYPVGPGLGGILRAGVNRALVGLDLSWNNMGGLFIANFGLRFGL